MATLSAIWQAHVGVKQVHRDSQKNQVLGRIRIYALRLEGPLMESRLFRACPGRACVREIGLIFWAGPSGCSGLASAKLRQVEMYIRVLTREPDAAPRELGVDRQDPSAPTAILAVRVLLDGFCPAGSRIWT